MKGDVVVTEEMMISMEDRILESIKNGNQKATLAQLHADLHIPKPTLHRYLVKMADNGTVNRVAKGRTVWFTTNRTQHSLPASTLSDRQVQAIRIAKETGRITRKQLSDAIGVSISTAGRELARLVSKGILKPNGNSGRMAGYTVL